jgi:membrane protease YdiL (CAAX protease family)
MAGSATETEIRVPAAPHVAAGPATGWLPCRAVWIAGAGLALSTVVPVVLLRPAIAAGAPVALLLALGMVAQWVCLVGACWVASRRFGSGRMFRDFGLEIDESDLRWGLRAWAAAWAAAASVGIGFAALGGNLLERDDRLFAFFGSGPLSMVVLVLVVVAGAPVAEELFYRGLLQGSLGPALGRVGAVIAQALVFGFVHTGTVSGAGNLVVVMALAGAGVVFGIAAHLRRVGTSVVAHAVFNTVSVAGRLVGG